MTRAALDPPPTQVTASPALALDEPRERPGERQDPSLELASRRTGLALQRTRMAADRTLMAVMRTALAMMSFGFSIITFFRTMKGSGVFGQEIPVDAARAFGQALLLLGTLLILSGIGFHVRFMLQVRRERAELIAEGLIRGRLQFPVSLTLLAACGLLLLGLFAALDAVMHRGPLSWVH